MTTAQILLMTCAYTIALAAVVYVTRATPRRIVGAFIGGVVAAGWGMGAILAGEALGVWQNFLPSTRGMRMLFYVGLAISLSPIYLVTWRVARRFGLRGLIVCLIVVGVIGPPRDYLFVATFPAWGAFAPGVAPVLADAATYIGLVALGHVVMRLVSGPARGSELSV